MGRSIARAPGCSRTPGGGQTLRPAVRCRHDRSGQNIAEQREAEGLLALRRGFVWGPGDAARRAGCF